MIRKILKYFLVNTASLYLINLVISGLSFSEGVTTLLLTGLALTIASLIIKPIINLLLLPINLITFGLFRWVSYAVMLYIVTLVVPGFEISKFYFSGLSTYWITIPEISIGGMLAFITFSLLISIISSIFDWLLK